jgi:SAM-dependent methyltransferase
MTVAEQRDGVSRYLGFDTGGEVFGIGDRVFRGIYPGKGELYRQVLTICAQHDLFRLGIVETRECTANPWPDVGYDLVLEHDRVPFVSYPHEWTTSMLLDAALLHVNLFEELSQVGLTVKDWHPYNILFAGPRPVFVDFASIVPAEHLCREPYLTPPNVPGRFRWIWDIHARFLHEMYARMCVPYFLLPLYGMAQGYGDDVRRHLRDNPLNGVGARDLTEADVFAEAATGWQQKYTRQARLKRAALAQGGRRKTVFLRLLRRELSSLRVPPAPSGYLEYYEAKSENFSFEPCREWTDKQRTVHHALTSIRPTSVLDIGCNTGWFSCLAATLGIPVVAVDRDEACVEALYAKAVADQLPVLPLVIDITAPTSGASGNPVDEGAPASLIRADAPLLIPAVERLRCDMVLALALVHHLALGQGLTLRQVVQTLSTVAARYLVVEFVPSDDDLVARNPAFFAAFHADPARFETYTLENFRRELARVFRIVDVAPSAPQPRVMFVCERP